MNNKSINKDSNIHRESQGTVTNNNFKQSTSSKAQALSSTVNKKSVPSPSVEPLNRDQTSDADTKITSNNTKPRLPQHRKRSSNIPSISSSTIINTSSHGSNTGTVNSNQRPSTNTSGGRVNCNKLNKSKPLQVSNRKKVKPLAAKKCRLLCVFYAEFDNIVGTKISFQSPINFMDLSVNVGMDEIHNILTEEFHRTGAFVEESNYSPGGVTPKTRNNFNNGEDNAVNFSPCNIRADNQNDNSQEEDALSIFDIVSDYVITKELAGEIISVSTCTPNVTILIRPAVIYNIKYERNSLMFSVGFVLRKDSDERPFKPLLSKIASTFCTLEVETAFLTDPSNRNKIYTVLVGILRSLNSKEAETNMIIGEANYLNLKLFKAAKPILPPAPDHTVPLLLKPEWQLQLFDWDLTVNWIIPYIDGVKNTKAIALESEVDLDMVRACLRVLRHHNVLTFIDIFQYSNVYEPTLRAGRMLSGLEPRLLDAVFFFVQKNTKKDFEKSPRVLPRPQNPGLSRVSSDDFSIGVTPSSYERRSSLKSNSTDKKSANEHAILNIREEAKSLKRAIAELYTALDRNLPFGETLKRLMRETKCPILHEKSDYSDDSIDCLDGKTYQKPRFIDWKKALGLLDHKRFVTFGVVHGLIQRVHNYPVTCEKSVLNGPSSEDMVDPSHALSTEERDIYTALVLAMDGTTSDDELCNRFERPLRELFDIVKRGGRDVLSIYSCDGKNS